MHVNEQVRVLMKAKARRGEARRSEAHMRMQDALSKLTGDPNMKLTQGQVRST